jgi:hypothetical protein
MPGLGKSGISRIKAFKSIMRWFKVVTATGSGYSVPLTDD